MKKMRMILSYYKGSGFTCFLLLIVLLGTLMITTMVSGRIKHMFSKSNVLESYDVGSIYYLQYFPSDEEFLSGKLGSKYEDFSKEIEGNSVVKGLFTVYTAQAVSFEGQQVAVILYTPEMVSQLLVNSPEQKMFEKNGQGAILAGRMFKGIKSGQSLRLDFATRDRYMEVSVLGHVDYPYSILALNASATNVRAEMLFSENDILP